MPASSGVPLATTRLSESDVCVCVVGTDESPRPYRRTAMNVYQYEVQPLRGYTVTWSLTNEITLNARNSADIQVGADASQGVSVDLYAIDRSALNLAELNLQGGGGNAVGVIDRAIDLVNESLASVGAAMGRLEVSSSAETAALQGVGESMAAITDTDFTTEVAHLVRAQLLDRMATAVTAQARVSEALALTLLEAL